MIQKLTFIILLLSARIHFAQNHDSVAVFVMIKALENKIPLKVSLLVLNSENKDSATYTFNAAMSLTLKRNLKYHLIIKTEDCLPQDLEFTTQNHAYDTLAVTIKKLKASCQIIRIPDVNFKFNSTVLDTSFCKALDDVVDYFNTIIVNESIHPTLHISGFADPRERNIARKRAQEVSKYLIYKGIKGSHIRIFKGVVNSTNTENAALNCKVTVKISCD